MTHNLFRYLDVRTKRENPRLYYIYIFFALLFSLLTLRIAYLQLIQKDLFKDLARKQHIKIIPLKGERGQIIDCRGRILATNINTYSVYADPALVSDKKETADELSELLNLDKEKITGKLNKNNRFVWIKRRISLNDKIKLEKLKLDGVGFIKNKMRLYPQGKLLSHILGGINIDNEGIEGLELSYDNVIKGKDGWVWVVRDSAANNLFLYPQILESTKGLDLHLTIDAQVQYWAEKFLEEAIEEYSAKGGSVLVIEPFNGEMLALASWPEYDPNRISSVGGGCLKNGAIADIFEPGSVFKIVSLVASLDRKVFSEEEMIFCENGKMKVPGTVLNDYKPYGNLTFREVFVKSSNIGVAKITSALGPDILYLYIRKLGFGQKTGIDLQGEAKGLLKHFKSWSRTTPYMIPMGQEVGVTAIQLARAMCVIANGGYLITPHLIKQFAGNYGFVKEVKTRRKRVIPPEVADAAKDILIQVVNDGTGQRAGIKGFTVGGKTGTGQKFDVNAGRYSSSAYRASFIGFVQNREHSFVLCVSIDEPKKSHFGGVVAAPVFRAIAEKLINYMENSQKVVSAR